VTAVAAAGLTGTGKLTIFEDPRRRAHNQLIVVIEHGEAVTGEIEYVHRQNLLNVCELLMNREPTG
jgi:hypothetical protein